MIPSIPEGAVAFPLCLLRRLPLVFALTGHIISPALPPPPQLGRRSRGEHDGPPAPGLGRGGPRRRGPPRGIGVPGGGALSPNRILRTYLHTDGGWLADPPPANNWIRPDLPRKFSPDVVIKQWASFLRLELSKNGGGGRGAPAQL